MRIVSGTAEAKLQNLHARHLELFAQGFDVIGDDTQILGNDRNVPELFLHEPHELLTRRRPPLATASVGSAGRDRPVRGQSTEVIDAQSIDAIELLHDPVAPERETVSLDRLPVIERIAPQLAIG